MSHAGFFLYTGDYLKDTRVLTLPARGAWADALCFLNEHGGSVTWPVSSFAIFWGISHEETRLILQELSETGVGCVEWQNDGKTIAKLSNRRMMREIQKRLETKEKRADAGKKGAAARWQKCGSSESESSSESLLSHKDTLVVKPDLTVHELVNSWNSCFTGKLPAVEWPLSASRSRKAAARLREHQSIDFWQRVWDNINTSRFLLGRNNGTWRCNLDFVIANDSNCIKIYEGAYNGERTHS